MITKTKKMKKGRWEQIFFAVFIIVFTLGLIGFLMVSDYRINQKRTELLDQIKSLEKQLQDLQKKSTELQSGIAQTGKDSYWEEKVREQGYKKPGEEQVVVLPPTGQSSTSTEPSKNLWQKFLDPIKNLFK